MTLEELEEKADGHFLAAMQAVYYDRYEKPERMRRYIDNLRAHLNLTKLDQKPISKITRLFRSIKSRWIR